MNCPHCQKDLPEKYSAGWCPFCGRDLSEHETTSWQAPEINWFVFFAVLLAPAVISLLGMMINVGAVIVLGTFIGSVLAGRFCGVKLAERLAGGMEPGRFSSFMFSAVFIVVSFILCFGGCILPVALGSKNR